MVQNAGFVLKNGHNKRRGGLEMVVIYLFSNLFSRWNEVKFRAVL